MLLDLVEIGRVLFERVEQVRVECLHGLGIGRGGRRFARVAWRGLAQVVSCKLRQPWLVGRVRVEAVVQSWMWGILQGRVLVHGHVNSDNRVRPESLL